MLCQVLWLIPLNLCFMCVLVCRVERLTQDHVEAETAVEDVSVSLKKEAV